MTLANKVSTWESMLNRLEAERDALREALAFYADPSSWHKDDWGVRGVIDPPDYGKPGFTARQALGLPEPAEEN